MPWAPTTATTSGEAAINSATTSSARLADARLTLALNAGGVGTWEWDVASEELHWDAPLRSIFGIDARSFGGTFDEWLALIHPDDRGDVIAAIQASWERGEYEVEHRIVRPDGQVRWLHCRGEVLTDADNAVTGMHGVAVDLTERRAAEAERDRLLAAEQAARDRLSFLAEASALLSRSLNANAAMTELAKFAVPRLGDWCVVDVVEREELQLMAVTHHDPEKVDLLRRWRAHQQPTFADGPGRVVRTGASELWPEMDEAALRTAASDDDHLAVLRSLQIQSVLVVPLVARGSVLGVLTLIHDHTSGRQHTPDDLALAEDLANRAGIALDNARLFQERAAVANVLQQALLPPDLPEIDGIELGARYQPASELVIGGDFYDVFDNGDGTWTVLVGDVCGKDTTAATLTALARHSARAAVVRDRDPRSVLRVVNHAFGRDGSSEHFCTAVCARLSLTRGGATLDVAVAGHPPPLLLRADGTVEAVRGHGQLIGLFDDPDLALEQVQLGEGDTLVLYTDGVTEARRDDELFGEERLVAALQGRTGLEPDALADAVLRSVAEFDNGDRRDDVAILAVQACSA